MSNKPPNIRKTQTLGGIALLALIGVIYFFLLSSRLAAPATISTERASDVAKMTSLEHQVITLQTLKNSTPAAVARAASLAKRFPAATESVVFESEVTSAATTSGIAVANVSQILLGATVLDSTNQSGVISVEIDATGTSSQIGTFITKLYSITRAMEIDTISLSATVVAKTVSQYTVKVNGNIFILKPNTAPPPATLRR